MTVVNKPVSKNVFPRSTVAPGSTKSSLKADAFGPWIDISAFNGGTLGGRIYNSAGALGAPPNLCWQWTPDPNGVPLQVYDLWNFGSDINNGTEVSATCPVRKDINYIRAICYGHTTNNVTFDSVFVGTN